MLRCFLFSESSAAVTPAAAIQLEHMSMTHCQDEEGTPLPEMEEERNEMLAMKVADIYPAESIDSCNSPAKV